MQDTNPAAQLFRAQLAEDAPKRERAICGLLVPIGAFAVVLALAAGSTIGWPLALSISAVVGVPTLYYLGLFFLLRRGFYAAWVPWLNMCIEVSVPGAVFALDCVFNGPVYASGASSGIAWPSLVTFMALRANARLALFAGALASLEYLAVYALLQLPAVDATAPASLAPAVSISRGLLLFMAGVGGAVVARNLLRKSEQALRAVRERDVMGKYLLQDRIGAGGMAEVFRALYCPEGGFQKVVAVKRVLPAYAGHEEFVRLFLEEARLGALLVHPNIVQVLDVGRHGDTFFLAMEFVEGLPLSAVIARLNFQQRRLPFAAVAFVGHQLAQALGYAHARISPDGVPLKLVHRDVNPPNVLLSKTGEVKLSDFGIARAATVSRVTQAGIIRGKPGYLAPEQALDEAIDARTDLYAVGLTLYEALTGEPAFSPSGSDTQLVRQAVLEDLPPPSALRPDVPRELDGVVARLLARDPAARFSSGEELARALLALPGDLAPFPHGQTLLAQAVAGLVAQSSGAAGADPETNRPTERVASA